MSERSPGPWGWYARSERLREDRPRPEAFLDPYGEPTTSTARVPRGAWQIARLLGADIYVHWSMVLIPFVLVTIIASSPAHAQAGNALLWTAIWTLVATAVIWSHCFAHLWASGAVAAGTGAVLLTPFAPLAHDSGPVRDPRTEIRTALAGPVSHALWFVAAYLIWISFDFLTTGGQMLHQFLLINAALWAACLLPFHPMDGGRILRAALTPSIGAARAEAWTASAGYGGAVTLGLVGLTLLTTSKEATPWAVFVIAVGVLTLTASQRALFAAQFRAHSERLAPAPTAEPEAVPDYLDETALARLIDGDAVATAPEVTERAVESADERRRRLQDRIDALLDRINEVGGMASLDAEERRELAETSELLRRETAES